LHVRSIKRRRFWAEIRGKHSSYRINRTEYPSDLVKKSGLRRNLCDKSCLRRILFHKKPSLRRILLIKNPLLKLSGMHFISSFLFCLPILS